MVLRLFAQSAANEALKICLSSVLQGWHDLGKNCKILTTHKTETDE
jgi:hypothetical protein